MVDVDVVVTAAPPLGVTTFVPVLDSFLSSPDDPEPVAVAAGVVVVVVVVAGSFARPLTVAVTGLKPVRDATTDTVDVADGANPETVIWAPERTTDALLVADTAYE